MKILVERDGGSFRLMCADARMSVTPAGQRLFRAPPIPDIKFVHDQFADAANDARVLQRYIDQTHGQTAAESKPREGGAFSV